MFNIRVLIVFLHGYPDSRDVWDSYVDKLKPGHHCLTMSYPGYEKDETLRHPDWPKYGVPISDFISQLKGLIEQQKATLEVKLDTPIEKLAVVMHDWGANLGWCMAATYPELFDKIVSLEIGPVNPFSPCIFFFSNLN